MLKIVDQITDYDKVRRKKETTRMIDVIKIISFSILIIEHFYDILIVLRSLTNIKKEKKKKKGKKDREEE